MIRTGANGAEAVRRQDPAVQFVSPGLPVSFMLPVRNLLQEYLRQHRSPLRYSAKSPTFLLTGAFYQPPLSKKQRFDCSAALKLQTGLMIAIPPHKFWLFPSRQQAGKHQNIADPMIASFRTMHFMVYYKGFPSRKP